MKSCNRVDVEHAGISSDALFDMFNTFLNGSSPSIHSESCPRRSIEHRSQSAQETLMFWSTVQYNECHLCILMLDIAYLISYLIN